MYETWKMEIGFFSFFFLFLASCICFFFPREGKRAMKRGQKKTDAWEGMVYIQGRCKDTHTRQIFIFKSFEIGTVDIGIRCTMIGEEKKKEKRKAISLFLSPYLCNSQLFRSKLGLHDHLRHRHWPRGWGWCWKGIRKGDARTRADAD